MLRKILGPAAGVIAAVAIVAVWEMLVHYVRPLPLAQSGQGTGDAATLLLVMLGYAAGALAGGAIAALIARAGAWPAWVPAGLLGLSAVVNVAMIPHPSWFIVLALAVIGAGGWLAGEKFGRAA